MKHTWKAGVSVTKLRSDMLPHSVPTSRAVDPLHLLRTEMFVK